MGIRVNFRYDSTKESRPLPVLLIVCRPFLISSLEACASVSPSSVSLREGYGSDGVHYFVRQYAGKPNPGIYFLFIQLVVDVVQGEDAQMLFTDCDVADADRHVDSASLVVERHLQFVSRAAIGKKGRKTRVHAVQLADVGKDIEAQQTEGFAVFLIYGTIVVQHEDAGIHAVQDEFVVLFLLGCFTFHIIKYMGNPVQCTVHEACVGSVFRFGEVDGIVVVFDGVEHEKHLPHMMAV